MLRSDAREQLRTCVFSTKQSCLSIGRQLALPRLLLALYNREQMHRSTVSAALPGKPI